MTSIAQKAARQSEDSAQDAKPSATIMRLPVEVRLKIHHAVLGTPIAIARVRNDGRVVLAQEFSSLMATSKTLRSDLIFDCATRMRIDISPYMRKRLTPFYKPQRGPFQRWLPRVEAWLEQMRPPSSYPDPNVIIWLGEYEAHNIKNAERPLVYLITEHLDTANVSVLKNVSLSLDVRNWQETSVRITFPIASPKKALEGLRASVEAQIQHAAAQRKAKLLSMEDHGIIFGTVYHARRLLVEAIKGITHRDGTWCRLNDPKIFEHAGREVVDLTSP